MPVEIRDKGEYELFETTRDNRILVLNNKNWFAWVEGQQGEILVHSDSDHKKSRTLQKGRFYRVDFNEDPKFRDTPHLFLEKDSKYQEVLVPEGLPTQRDHQKKVVMTDETIDRGELEDYLEHPSEAGPGEGRAGRPGGGSIANVTHYLQGVDFPAHKEDVLKHAKGGNAPQEVMDQLEKLSGRNRYDTMAELTEAIGERTWHPPIEDYDRLDVDEIEEKIDSLSWSEASQLRDYEAKNKKRKTLMQAFQRKLGG